MLDKKFHPKDVETRIYAEWQDSNVFACGQRPDAEPYCIVIPPPNVTGRLHMGHALNNTIQDILVRFQRMNGKDVLWQPGLDHAGIATQMVVERQLEAEANKSRRDMGRDAFVERVWEWKAESGGAILEQLKRLGASCDWSRERFTMDEGLSKAVLKVFVQLHREGLIYRDKRLVNWDPQLLTAISDLEVEQVEADGHLWHFKYPIEGKDGSFITVATTRPETMLGDTGVAVNPEDERYKHLIGKHVILPIVGRRIPIIADEYADPEQGSGAVKITPAHDFNDFEVGRRCNLDVINIFDAHACLNENVPTEYQGLERYAARDKVVAQLESQGLLAQIDDHKHTIPYGDRSHVVIEPWLTDQWYVNAEVLAKPAIEAVENGDMTFVPKNWERTYFEWMRNIQPWCISRQLWWGHQIPAWYGPDGEVFVAENEDEAAKLAQQHYGKTDVELKRDEDVLDTWFSSALWPFSTLGWPEETSEVERFYPNNVLVTGFDIIFFWVARMMMMGLHFKQEVPFHTTYIHALVRDEKGQKMSKSKGNIIDPLDLVDEFGADALRFTLAAMAAQGRDIKLAKSRIEGYRNFGTKLWNAARFCEMNECIRNEEFDPKNLQSTVNRWMVGEVVKAQFAVTKGIEEYKFNEAAGAIYHCVWHIFCDWYVEFIKPQLNGRDEALKKETRETAAWVLDQLILLLHPFMPFITEELWQRIADSGMPRQSLLALAPWPDHDIELNDKTADEEMDWVIRLVSEVRSVRSEMNVPAGSKVTLLIKDASAISMGRLERHRDVILPLARLDKAAGTDTIPDGAVQTLLDEATLILPLADVIDIDQEKQRLEKEIAKTTGDIHKIDKKLANKNFVEKAPAHVIEEQHDRRAVAEQARARLQDALIRLTGAA